MSEVAACRLWSVENIGAWTHYRTTGPRAGGSGSTEGGEGYPAVSRGVCVTCVTSSDTAGTADGRVNCPLRR